MTCAHEPCSCLVDDGGYCHPACHQAAIEAGIIETPAGVGSIPLHECLCGHASCLDAQQPALDA